MALIHSKQLNPKLTGSFILSGSQQDFLGTNQISFTGPSKFVGSITGSVNGDVSMSYNSTGSFGRAEIVGDASFGENVEVKQYIKHKGDDNTFINFTDNRIRMNAGGINFLSLEDDGSAPYPFVINNGGNRINFRVMDRNNELLLKTDSEAYNVGLYHAGDKKLETTATGVEVTGNITATGDIIAESLIVSSSVTNMIIAEKSGSTTFGDDSGDTHRMTGSLLVTGSLNVETGRIFEQGTSVIDHATAMAIVFGG